MKEIANSHRNNTFQTMKFKKIKMLKNRMTAEDNEDNFFLFSKTNHFSGIKLILRIGRFRKP